MIGMVNRSFFGRTYTDQIENLFILKAIVQPRKTQNDGQRKIGKIVAQAFEAPLNLQVEAKLEHIRIGQPEDDLVEIHGRRFVRIERIAISKIEPLIVVERAGGKTNQGDLLRTAEGIDEVVVGKPFFEVHNKTRPIVEQLIGIGSDEGLCACH